jgi:hypothetical protein
MSGNSKTLQSKKQTSMAASLRQANDRSMLRSVGVRKWPGVAGLDRIVEF